MIRRRSDPMPRRARSETRLRVGPGAPCRRRAAARVRSPAVGTARAAPAPLPAARPAVVRVALRQPAEAQVMQGRARGDIGIEYHARCTSLTGLRERCAAVRQREASSLYLVAAAR